MARLTPAEAVRHIRYIDREEQAGRLTEVLAEKREHRVTFLLRSHACFQCGERITNPESLRLWERDRLGPVCRARLAGPLEEAS